MTIPKRLYVRYQLATNGNLSPQVVVHGSHESFNSGELQAIANVVSAAPEMLDALKGCLRTQVVDLLMVHAAIAKAEGRTL
jgi:hypothetical protein